MSVKMANSTVLILLCILSCINSEEIYNVLEHDTVKIRIFKIHRNATYVLKCINRATPHTCTDSQPNLNISQDEDNITIEITNATVILTNYYKLTISEHDKNAIYISIHVWAPYCQVRNLNNQNLPTDNTIHVYCYLLNTLRNITLIENGRILDKSSKYEYKTYEVSHYGIPAPVVHLLSVDIGNITINSRLKYGLSYVRDGKSYNIESEFVIDVVSTHLYTNYTLKLRCNGVYNRLTYESFDGHRRILDIYDGFFIIDRIRLVNGGIYRCIDYKGNVKVSIVTVFNTPIPIKPEFVIIHTIYEYIMINIVIPVLSIVLFISIALLLLWVLRDRLKKILIIRDGFITRYVKF